jgi:hypothetical protein
MIPLEGNNVAEVEILARAIFGLDSLPVIQTTST